MFGQFKQRLSKVFGGSKRLIARAVGRLKGLKVLDDTSLKDFEKALIEADMGLLMTRQLIEALQSRFAAGIKDDNEVVRFIQAYLTDLLVHSDLVFSDPTNVVMMIGVNGVGKTTTIGKLAHYYRKQNLSVGMIPADTYRAAAYEQLQHWCDETGAKMFHQPNVKDPAAVVFDAMQQSAGKVDILFADTAGRMHGAQNLMDQLIKVKRVMGKVNENAPQHVWLVLDGSLGQNSIAQAKVFHEQLNLTGLIVTKLDGSAKGGVLFEIVKQLGLPIYFIGLGEGIDDLQPFDASAYVEQMLLG